MKFAVISDLHLHVWPYGDPLDRLNNGVEALKFALERASQERVDFVAVTGDLFHTAGRVSTPVLSATYDAFKRYKHLKYIFVPGNHDQTFRHQEENAMCVFDSFGPVVDFDTPENELAGRRFFALPYTEEEDRIKRFLESCTPGSVVLMHQGVKAVEVNNSGFVLNEGINPEWVPDDIHSLFTGHYHSHKRFSLQGTIPGALTQHNFGDVDDERGFLLVEGDQDPRIEQIETPAYKFVNLDYEDSLEWTVGQAEATRGNFLRVREVPPHLVSEIQQRFSDMKLWPADPMVLPASKSHTRIDQGVQHEMNLRVTLDKYIEATEIAEDDARVGREILEVSGAC